MPQNPQTPDQGAGPLTERRYYLDITHPRQTAAALMHDIQCNIERYAPGLLAEFHKAKGEPHGLQVGDEYHIKILGPWNGSVRVTEAGRQHFELLTLEGHPEAGHIRFSLRQLPNQPDVLRFEIHSKARARDGLVAFAYGTLGVGKQVQEQVWVTFCQRVAEESGGQPLGPVQVETVEQDGAERRTEHHERS